MNFPSVALEHSFSLRLQYFATMWLLLVLMVTGTGWYDPSLMTPADAAEWKLIRYSHLSTGRDKITGGGGEDSIYQPLLNATLMSSPRQFKTHSHIDSCDSNGTHMTARWTNDPHVTSTTLKVWATSAEVKYRSTVSPVGSSWRSFKYIVLGFAGGQFEKEVTIYKQVYRQMLGATLASAVISISRITLFWLVE